jgi:hypothetical protein
MARRVGSASAANVALRRRSCEARWAICGK